MLEHQASGLPDFEKAVATVWSEYRRLGPGQLQPTLYEPVRSAYDALLDELISLSDELTACVEQLRGLSEKCVLTPQGLSFVTGEAGLVPRQELIDAYDTALLRLRREIAGDETQC